jgi:hypothetical protein
VEDHRRLWYYSREKELDSRYKSKFLFFLQARTLPMRRRDGGGEREWKKREKMKKRYRRRT